MLERNIKLLSHEDMLTAGAANMDIAEKAILTSFTSYGLNKAFMPKKTILNPTFASGQINVMPCVIDENHSPIFSIKIIGSNPNNSFNGIPTMSGIAILFDHNTNAPLAIMDVEALSAFRTGAVTRVAAKYLIQSMPSVILLIGAGPNMKTQFIALKPFINTNTKIYVYSRGDSKHKFINDMNIQEQAIAITNLNDDIIKQADIIVGCIPNLGEPVIKNSCFKPGMTFFNIGLIDICPTLIPSFDQIIVDDWECSKTRGDTPHVYAFQQGLISNNDVESILPYIIEARSARRDPNNKIFFSPVGLSTHDAIFAKNIYDIAMENNIGSNFSLSKFTPYV